MTTEPRPFAELRGSGLLWLINRVLFHPRGHALALVVDEHGDAIGWELQGDGEQLWRFRNPQDEDGHFAAAEATLAAAAAAHRLPDPLPGHTVTVGNREPVGVWHPPGCDTTMCRYQLGALGGTRWWPPGRYELISITRGSVAGRKLEDGPEAAPDA